MSHRKKQVESSIKRAIAMTIARDLSDPRIRGMVSVTRVKASNNLQEAFVYVSILPEQYERRSIAGLNAASHHIMSHVAKAIRMRTLPRLIFRLDSSIKKQAEVEQAIRQGMPSQDLAPPDAPTDPSGVLEVEE